MAGRAGRDVRTPWKPHVRAFAGLAALVVCATLVLAPVSIAAAVEASGSAGAVPFRSAPFQALDTPKEWRYFYWPTPVAAAGATDTVHGRVINGVWYDFALRQAEQGLVYVNSYELTGNEWYLGRARAQADRLIARRRTQGEAWYFTSAFPYRFDRRYGGSLTPPWYSGIAQGAALGLFARLYEATGDPAYLDAAEHTLESFLVPEGKGRVWVSRSDTLRYLRLEEYPGTRWRFVLNGHIEAVFGLYEYYMVTRDERALALYRSGLTTLVRYGEQFRNPGWISAYSLGARAPYASYHTRVVRQFLTLYSLSGDTRFVHLANEYDSDYPVSRSGGVARVTRGTYRAYRFSSGGRVLAVRRLTVRATQRLGISKRASVKGRTGTWLTVATGGLKGYLLREAAGRVYLRGAVDPLDYRPPLSSTLRAGTWRFIKVDGAGVITYSVSAASAAEEVTVGRRAVVNGAPMAQLASGPHEGYWVPQRAVALP